jgi:hypothetical protein
MLDISLSLLSDSNAKELGPADQWQLSNGCPVLRSALHRCQPAFQQHHDQNDTQYDDFQVARRLPDCPKSQKVEKISIAG